MEKHQQTGQINPRTMILALELMSVDYRSIEMRLFTNQAVLLPTASLQNSGQKSARYNICLFFNSCFDVKQKLETRIMSEQSSSISIMI